jgi:hypothetical protein
VASSKASGKKSRHKYQKFSDIPATSKIVQQGSIRDGMFFSSFNQHSQRMQVNVYSELYSLKTSMSYRDQVAITTKADKHAGTLNAGKNSTGSGTYGGHNVN